LSELDLVEAALGDGREAKVALLSELIKSGNAGGKNCVLKISESTVKGARGSSAEGFSLAFSGNEEYLG
jgi:hypothetical protein